MAQVQRGPHGLEDVGPAVGDIHPTGPFRGRADALKSLSPELRLAPPLETLDSRLPLGAGLAGADLLERQAEDLAGLGVDGQAVVLEEAAAAAITDGPGASEGLMGGEVQLSRIMEDQQGIGLIHPLTRESEMRGRDPVVGHFGAVTKAIDGTEWIPGEFGRERPFGLVGDLMCGDDQSFGASFVPELGGAEVLGRPGLGVVEMLSDHPCEDRLSSVNVELQRCSY